MCPPSADRVEFAAAVPVSVLVVEDDPDHRVLLTRALTRHRPAFDVTVVARAEECLAAVAGQDFSVILLDYSLPGTDGIAALAELRRRGVEAPVVMITGQGDERIAVAAMNSGATDYVMKTPGYLATIPTVVYKVLKQHELARENARLYAETQHRLEALEAAQERLIRVETLRALGELASGTAHHLNNLLAVITARVDLLMVRDPAPDARGALEIIRRAASDGTDVVRRIQEFARTNQLDRCALDLDDLVLEVVEMTRGRWQDAAHAQGITIDVKLELAGGPRVLGHAASLREVLTNLIINAVDALPDGGHIRIRTWPDGDMVALAVTDDGIGMSDHVLRRAQQPFFTTKGVKSTGLGLAVNYGIMQQHRGDLAIDSGAGRGTTVTVRVPRAPADVAPAAPTAVARKPVGPLTILIVDDEDEVREAIADLIGISGHSVREAGSAAAALEQLARGDAPDLVVTDFGMPGMTGCDLAVEVKRRWPLVKVALVTGWGAEHVTSDGLPDGVDFVLSKPLDYDALNAILARVS